MEKHELNQQIEQEILQNHRSPTNPLAKAAHGLIEGKELVPRQIRAVSEIHNWLQDHLHDSEGALLLTLKELCKEEVLLYSHLWDQPLLLLKEILECYVQNVNRMELLVRQVDVLWAKLYDERPMFQACGEIAKKDDPYTHDGVRKILLHHILQLSIVKNGVGLTNSMNS